MPHSRRSNPPARTMLLAVSIAAIAACGGAAPASTPAPVSPSASVAPASSPVLPSAAATSIPGGSSSPDAPASSAPATPDPAAAAAAALASRPWAIAELTDVETGQPFRIADFAGRTVFVESMAIWCTNCRQQQARFREALERLDPESVAYVVLTVEPSESAQDLARYKAERGFAGSYAVAGRDVAAALKDEFGAIVLSPPSVPLVVVAPDGTIDFRTGGESVDDIVATAGG